MNIAEFKQNNPQYQDYQNVPIKDFLSQVGVDPVQAQIDAGRDENLWGYWRDQVSQKLDGETEQQQRERLYGADSRAKPDSVADLRAKPDSVADLRAKAELWAYEPGFMERVGNAVFDGAKSIGLPANRVRRDLNALGTGIRNVADGAVLGFGDEFSAGMGALTGIGGEFGNYEGNLAREWGITELGKINHPNAAALGNITGAVAVPFGAAKAGATLLKGGMSTPKAMGFGALEGSAYGALAGAGYAEGDLSERAKGAASGAGAGAATGAGVPVLISGGSALGRLVRDKVAANIGPLANKVKTRLVRAMRQAGMTPDEIAAKLDDLGPDGMLVDALGEPGAALARSASNVSPAARETLENASTSRMAGQPDRLTDALLNASGLDQPRTLQELQEAARASARPAISEAYDSARSSGHDIDLKAFDDLRQSDIVAKAYSDGQRLAKDRMIAEASRAGNVGDNVLKNGPSNFDILDETKKSLDARAAPALGQQQTNEQAIAGQFSKTIRNRIDEYMPEYGGARDLVRQLHQQQDAIALGASGAKPRVAADFARQADAVIPSHKPELAKGYAAAKVDQIDNRRTTPGAIDAMFGSKRQREALAAALGEKASGVKKQLNAEKVFAGTHRALTGNSTTARQLAEMGVTSTAGAGLGFAAGGDLQSTGLGALAGLLARRGGAATVRALTAKKEAQVAPMIADILAGREIPQEMMQQIKRNPALQQLLVRVLAQQSGGTAGHAVTAP